MNAFEYFGGAPEVVKIDNLKAAILEANFYEPAYQRMYRDFSVYYGFKSMPCRAYHPNDKGKVESGIKYVKGNFFKGRSFEATLPALHDTEDYNRRCYVSKNRKNEEETFNLLSISIGMVSTEVYKIKSFAHLASIATEVKKAAKMKSALSGASSIARDRRLMG